MPDQRVLDAGFGQHVAVDGRDAEPTQDRGADHTGIVVNDTGSERPAAASVDADHDVAS